MMLRTQIYIPKPLHQTAKLVAKRKKRAVASLYRELITSGLEAELQRQAEKSLDSLLQLKFRGGPKDLSANIDHYLYGAPKKSAG